MKLFVMFVCLLPLASALNCGIFETAESCTEVCYCAWCPNGCQSVFEVSDTSDLTEPSDIETFSTQCITRYDERTCQDLHHTVSHTDIRTRASAGLIWTVVIETLLLAAIASLAVWFYCLRREALTCCGRTYDVL